MSPSHGGRRDQGSLWSLLCKTVHLPKPPLPNITPLSIRIPTGEFGMGWRGTNTQIIASVYDVVGKYFPIRPKSQYSQLRRPACLRRRCGTLDSWCQSSPRQCVNQRTQLCSNKTLLTQTRRRPDWPTGCRWPTPALRTQRRPGASVGVLGEGAGSPRVFGNVMN